MRSILLGIFAAILLVMLTVTTWAFLDRSVLAAGNLFEDRWFVATFCDAYCGFLTGATGDSTSELLRFARIKSIFRALMG